MVLEAPKKIIVFATWGKNPWEWWSGFKVMHERFTRDSKVEIAKVISNYPNGWVYSKAQDLWLVFEHMNKPYDAESYQKIIKDTQYDLIALSGYLKKVEWLDPTKCINIHPGPLTPEYSGPGMYGHHVHDAVWRDYQEGKIKRTCVSMHFVNPEQYDDPNLLFFQYPVELEWCTSAEDVAKKVNAVEHERQWKITQMVAQWEIQATQDPETKVITIKFPEWYLHKWPISLTGETHNHPTER